MLTKPNSKKNKMKNKPKILKFIENLLLDTKYNDIIKWRDIDNAVFTLTEPNIVAKLWGNFVGNPQMTYGKFSRTLRHYYKDKYLEHSDESFTYKFLK